MLRGRTVTLRRIWELVVAAPDAVLHRDRTAAQVAIGASGIGHGDVIPSLTLAPALLAAMVFLLLRVR
ncbi:MAG: hypothetical protein ACRDNK_11960 [Solirubrobacteraceae bacterium]